MKQIVLTACIVNYHDDRGGVAEPEGAIIDVTKEDARRLAEMGRTLYCAKEDDHTKEGTYTADKALLEAAKKAASSKGSSAS